MGEASGPQGLWTGFCGPHSGTCYLYIYNMWHLAAHALPVTFVGLARGISLHASKSHVLALISVEITACFVRLYPCIHIHVLVTDVFICQVHKVNTHGKSLMETRQSKPMKTDFITRKTELPQAAVPGNAGCIHVHVLHLQRQKYT